MLHGKLKMGNYERFRKRKFRDFKLFTLEDFINRPSSKFLLEQMHYGLNAWKGVNYPTEGEGLKKP